MHVYYMIVYSHNKWIKRSNKNKSQIEQTDGNQNSTIKTGDRH